MNINHIKQFLGSRDNYKKKWIYTKHNLAVI